MNRDAALRQALLNDMEIMRALITIMNRQIPGQEKEGYFATEQLLRSACSKTADVLNAP